MHTKQSYLDEAVAYLRTMKRQAKDTTIDDDGNEWTSCTYFNVDTQERCVVGHFIPDKHKALESQAGVAWMTGNYPDLNGVAWPLDGVTLAEELQMIHDQSRNWNENGFVAWEKIAQLAEYHGLQYNESSEILEEELVDGRI